MSRLNQLWRRLSSGPSNTEDPTPANILKRAQMAQAEGRWAAAAELYAIHAQRKPGRAGTRVQIGNMLKQSGNRAGAEEAYRAAIALKPTVEAWSQLGYLMLTSGRAPEAVLAFEAALALATDHQAARDGLVLAGARDRAPRGEAIDTASLARLKALSLEANRVIARAADDAIAPLVVYDAFRKAVMLPPPPPFSPVTLMVRIDGRGVAPYRVRASLLSLIDQTSQAWTAVVLGDDALLAHPVAALAASEPRIRFERLDTEVEAESVVVLEAGVVLEPATLAWLSFAADHTGAAVVYADHDHRVEATPDQSRYHAPAFHPAPDPDDLASTPALPPVTLWRSRDEAALPWSDLHSASALRQALVSAASIGRAGHLPLVLSSVLDLPAAAAGGLPAPTEMQEGYLSPRATPSISLVSSDDGGDLAVIIPTRDELDLLVSCVDSLRRKAARPDRLRLLVVDNRSTKVEMASYLAVEAAAGRLAVLGVDESFNWSRLNNLAVSQTDASHLLFLNNDTQMITPGWDVRLMGQLARPDIGVVGARLLYPDGALQHAGIVLGLANGTPRHEGVGAIGADAGPLNRWRRPRSVAAVTGAFMGMRREVFDAVGGFDALNLSIAYNDIDFCLRCREAGLRVLFDGGIEMTHHESRTRGLNDTKGRMAWDVGEWTSLRRRWGEVLTADPAVNPHWATTSIRPFDGVRPVGRDEAVQWLGRSLDAWTIRSGRLAAADFPPADA